jgi:hypothetical protein
MTWFLNIPLDEYIDNTKAQSLNFTLRSHEAQLEDQKTKKSSRRPSTVPQVGADGKEIKDDTWKVLMMPNPDFQDWDATDQQVLSHLLGSLSNEIPIHISTYTTSAEAWATIHGVFASKTRARTMNTRLALGTTKKGNLSAMDYFSKMKSLGDEMAATGRPLDDKELIEYIITGLDGDYTPLISVICARAEPISLGHFYSQLLSFKTHVGLLQDGKNKSINAATTGGFRG